MSAADILILGVALVTGAASAVMVRRDGALPSDRTRLAFAAVTGIGATLTIVQFAAAWLEQPGDPWNAARVAPAIAMHHGFDLYSPANSGPVLSTVVGPVAFLPYWVLGFAEWSSTGLILGAVALNLAGLIALGAWGACRLAPSRAAALLALLVGAQLVLHYASLRYSLLTVHADAPALLFGAAGVLLMAQPRETPVSWGHCTLVALFLTLSVWAKQSMLPIFVAVAFIAKWRGGAAGVIRFGAATVAVFTLVSLVFVVSFGFGILRDNMVVVPAGHPWRQMSLSTGEIYPQLHAVGSLAHVKVLAAAALDVIRQNWPLFALLVAVVLTTWGRNARGWHQTYWAALACAAVVLFPTAAMGRVKVGGEVNHESFVVFFLVAAFVAWLLESPARDAVERVTRLTAVASTLLLINAPHGLGYRGWRQAWENQNQVAEDYLRRHPGSLYFPWNPLAALLAEKRLHHFDYGVFDRNLSGVEVTHEHLAEHLPSARPFIASTIAHHDYIVGRYFPDYIRHPAGGELPGWWLYGPPGTAFSN